MKRFRMGQLYRYPRPALPGLPDIDGIPNFHYIVASDGSPKDHSFVFSTTSSVKCDATDSWTSMRLTAVQRCPEFL